MHRQPSAHAVFLVLLSLPGIELRAGAAPASMSPKTRSFWEQDYATGDWGGLRNSLEERGVIFNFTYVADVFGVVAGGIRRGAFYNGFLDLGTDIDLEKLLGWNGAHFHVNGFYPHGVNGSAKYVGDIGTFSNIEAYDTYRLYELWVEQDFFDDRVSLRAGQTTFDSEFAVLDSYGGLFIQSGFGAPEAFSANLPLPVYPNATPGIRARIEPMKGLYLQAAVFDGNVAPGLTADRSPNAAPSSEFNRHGTQWALREEEGALLAGEIGYRFNQVEEAAEPSATRTTLDTAVHRPGTPIAPKRGLAGSYKVGFLYHTDDFADIYDTTLSDLGSSLAPGEPRNRGANYAIYANFEQEIWREAGSEIQGLGVFGHAAWMPQNRNFLEFSFEGPNEHCVLNTASRIVFGGDRRFSVSHAALLERTQDTRGRVLRSCSHRSGRDATASFNGGVQFFLKENLMLEAALLTSVGRNSPDMTAYLGFRLVFRFRS